MARKRIERTTEPLFPEHPKEEHRWRLQRARQYIMLDGLDALIFARNVSAFYMTGSRFVFVGWDAPSSLAPQTMAIVTQDADIYCQRFGLFDNDEVSIHTTLSESLESYDDEAEIVAILSDYGIGKGARVGIEWGSGQCTGINPLKFMELQKQLKNKLGAEFVDGTPTIQKIMAVKSELEVERMKRAVTAAARAMERVYQVIEVGMNEIEVRDLAIRYMIEEGGESVTHAQVMAEGKEGLSFLSCDALDRTIEAGWVHLDLGCKYRRYGSDINRGVFLGREPTAAEVKLYECRLGANELLDSTIKPGVPIDEAVQALDEYIRCNGYVLKELGGSLFAGHGIGMEPYQPPNLVPSKAQEVLQNEKGLVLFEPGMMFTYEMVIEDPENPNIPFFNIEDDVVVTESGVENMNSMLSRDLRVRA